MVNESNNNFTTSINSSSRRAAGRRYSGRQSNNSNSVQASSLRQRIEGNRSTIFSRSGNTSSSNSNNEISSNESTSASSTAANTSSAGAQTSSNQSLTKEEKLDQILKLLEDLGGGDVTQGDLDKLIAKFGGNKKQNFISGDDLIPDSKKSSAKNIEIKADPKEEFKFSSFKIDFANSQIKGLNNLLKEWNSVKDTKPEAKQQIKQIKSQIAQVNSSKSFWQSRKSSWDRKANKRPLRLEGGNKYLSQQIQKNRQKMTNIENKVDALYGQDASPNQRTKLAVAKGELRLLEAVDEFALQENKFWFNQNKIKYEPENQQQVKDSYEQIEAKQTEILELYSGGNKQTGAAFSSAAQLKVELQELKNGLKSLTKRGYSAYEGQVKPHEEMAFSSFKRESYDSQDQGLNNLREEWRIAADLGDPAAKSQLDQIRAQMKLTTEAKKFWTEENHFWMKLNNIGQSDENQAEIDELMSKITSLENLMDEWVSVEDDSGAANVQKDAIKAEISLTKNQIKNLHSGF